MDTNSGLETAAPESHLKHRVPRIVESCALSLTQVCTLSETIAYRIPKFVQKFDLRFLNF